MSDRERDETKSNPRYDNWPIEGSDEDVRYVGLAGGAGDSGSPMLYQETDETVYEGTIDEKNERIVVDEESAREIESGTTIDDVVESLADELGWESLADWVREERDDERSRPDEVEFQERNVAADADHDYAFSGSYTYFDETDRAHMVERTFEVHADPERRENGGPVVSVVETRLVAEEPREEQRDGDAERVDRTVTELVPEVDADAEREKNAVREWCRDWHESHLVRFSE